MAHKEVINMKVKVDIKRKILKVKIINFQLGKMKIKMKRYTL